MYTARSLSGAGECPRCGATGGSIHVVKADVARIIARRLDLPPERSDWEAVGEVVVDPRGELVPGQRVATAMGGMMFSRHGGYAERIAVKRNNMVVVDVPLSAARLAGLPEAYLTAWGALDKDLEIAAGESLLVRGGPRAWGRPRSRTPGPAASPCSPRRATRAAPIG